METNNKTRLQAERAPATQIVPTKIKFDIWNVSERVYRIALIIRND